MRCRQSVRSGGRDAAAPLFWRGVAAPVPERPVLEVARTSGFAPPRPPIMGRFAKSVSLEDTWKGLRGFFSLDAPPPTVVRTCLASSNYRTGVLQMAKSNGAWEPALVTLDGATLIYRKTFLATVRAKFVLASTTKLTEQGNSCFVLESQYGTRLELDALTPAARASWMQSILANRAWIAHEELEQHEDLQVGGGGPGGGGGSRRAGKRDSGGAVATQFLAASLPSFGTSFSDEPAALLRGWNFVSDTPMQTAHDRGSLQLELLLQGFCWPVDLAVFDNFEACFVQVAVKPFSVHAAAGGDDDSGWGGSGSSGSGGGGGASSSSGGGGGGLNSPPRRRVLGRTLPVPLCHNPQFPEALLLELSRSDFDGSQLDFSVCVRNVVVFFFFLHPFTHSLAHWLTECNRCAAP